MCLDSKSLAETGSTPGIGRERRGVEVEREERESDGGRAQKGMKKGERSEEMREGSTHGDGTAHALASPSGGEKNKDENDWEGNEGKRREGRKPTTQKRTQTHLGNKQPEQHDELEPKRDLPHAYGLGAPRGAGCKNEEEDARRGNDSARRKEERRDKLTMNKITNHYPTVTVIRNTSLGLPSDTNAGATALMAAAMSAAPREKMSVKSTGGTRRLGGDGVGLGRYGLAIRVEQAKVRAERTAARLRRPRFRFCLIYLRFRVRTGREGGAAVRGTIQIESADGRGRGKYDDDGITHTALTLTA
ncbi:hypothetical protein B0H13DRAFT_1918538 [Mycena leptocephala]|nr:hypothetical protein B0H13DRAFT_1918538 [Mycena leptocephala]